MILNYIIKEKKNKPVANTHMEIPFITLLIMSLQMASPACTELEAQMMDWLGKMLGLPEVFLNCSEGPGGGVIQV